jgi:hypothetical protein
MSTISTPNQKVASQQSQEPAPFPWNRVVTALSPVIALLAGSIASWLAIHFPGLHLNTGQASGEIAQGIIFAAGALGTVAVHYKWLDGWQKWESTLAPAVGPALRLVQALDPDDTRVHSTVSVSPGTGGTNNG